jgi:hypothetical protein
MNWLIQHVREKIAKTAEESSIVKNSLFLIQVQHIATYRTINCTTHYSCDKVAIDESHKLPWISAAKSCYERLVTQKATYGARSALESLQAFCVFKAMLVPQSSQFVMSMFVPSYSRERVTPDLQRRHRHLHNDAVDIYTTTLSTSTQRRCRHLHNDAVDIYTTTGQ